MSKKKKFLKEEAANKKLKSEVKSKPRSESEKREKLYGKDE